MRNMKYRNILEKTVDFTDMLEFNCQNKNNVFHYTNVVWIREYPNGETIVVPQADRKTLVEPRPW